MIKINEKNYKMIIQKKNGSFLGWNNERRMRRGSAENAEKNPNRPSIYGMCGKNGIMLVRIEMYSYNMMKIEMSSCHPSAKKRFEKSPIRTVNSLTRRQIK